MESEIERELNRLYNQRTLTPDEYTRLRRLYRLDGPSRFCEDCGKYIPAEATQCPFCGARTEPSMVLPEPIPEEVGELPEPVPEEGS